MNSSCIEVGDRVYFEGRMTPLRVAGHCHLQGERAVELIRQSDLGTFRRRGRGHVTIVRRIAIADLLRRNGGWKERWRQLSLDLDQNDHRTPAEKEAVA